MARSIELVLCERDKSGRFTGQKRLISVATDHAPKVLIEEATRGLKGKKNKAKRNETIDKLFS